MRVRINVLLTCLALLGLYIWRNIKSHDVGTKLLASIRPHDVDLQCLAVGPTPEMGPDWGSIKRRVQLACYLEVAEEVDSCRRKQAIIAIKCTISPRLRRRIDNEPCVVTKPIADRYLAQPQRWQGVFWLEEQHAE
jgi:hypothetical protein